MGCWTRAISRTACSCGVQTVALEKQLAPFASAHPQVAALFAHKGGDHRVPHIAVLPCRRVEGHVAPERKNYGYGERCRSERELTARIREMYGGMVLPSIPRGLCGCVYTQLSDVEGETNGLYTYDLSTSLSRWANQPEVVMKNRVGSAALSRR